MAPKHQLGSGMHAIYRPSSMRTIGYKRGQVGAGFFTSLTPKLKVIGKKFGHHALKASLDFINEVVVEKNRLNKRSNQLL
jgi:hypothetical protein